MFKFARKKAQQPQVVRRERTVEEEIAAYHLYQRMMLVRQQGSALRAEQQRNDRLWAGQR